MKQVQKCLPGLCFLLLIACAEQKSGQQQEAKEITAVQWTDVDTVDVSKI